MLPSQLIGIFMQKSEHFCSRVMLQNLLGVQLRSQWDSFRSYCSLDSVPGGQRLEREQMIRRLTGHIDAFFCFLQDAHLGGWWQRLDFELVSLELAVTCGFAFMYAFLSIPGHPSDHNPGMVHHAGALAYGAGHHGDQRPGGWRGKDFLWDSPLMAANLFFSLALKLLRILK